MGGEVEEGGGDGERVGQHVGGGGGRDGDVHGRWHCRGAGGVQRKVCNERTRTS